MSDNKLLSENTIRRFMKLANVDTLSDNFLDTLQERGMGYKRADGKHEDDLEEGGMRGKDEDDLEEGDMRGKDEDDLEEGEMRGKDEDDLEEGEMRGKDEDDLEEGMHEKDEDDLEEAMHGKDEDEVVDLDDEGDMGDMDDFDADLSMTREEAEVLASFGVRIDKILKQEPDAGVPDEDMAGMDDMDDMDDVGDPGEMDAEDRDEIVQEVLRRVTQRLVEAKLRRK